MTQVSVSELKAHVGKYIIMAQDQDILITKNGKIAAKLVTAKPDKKAAAERLFSILPDGLRDINLDAEREARILENSI